MRKSIRKKRFLGGRVLGRRRAQRPGGLGGTAIIPCANAPGNDLRVVQPADQLNSRFSLQQNHTAWFMHSTTRRTSHYVVRVLLCCSVVCCSVLCCSMLCSAALQALCCALCGAVLCCAVLCYGLCCALPFEMFLQIVEMSQLKPAFEVLRPL